MAQEFLSQLLKIENSVQPDDRQSCVICLQEIGSLSSETGIIECQIRLPCNHLVGSHCIANWLHENNTCPVCRSVFFPAQPRPYLEHGFMQDGDNDSDANDDDSENDSDYDREIGVDDEDRYIRMRRNIERSIRLLDISYAGRMTSLLIERHSIWTMHALRDRSRWPKVAVSIFVASHLVRQPVTLEQVSMVMEIPKRTILHTYRLFYPERESVIDRECLFLLREDPQRATTGRLWSLAWPPPADSFEEEWRTDAFWERIVFRLRSQTEFTVTLMEISRALAPRLMHSTHLDANSTIEVTALCVYIASYMRGVPISCREIASATGVSEAKIRVIYALFHPHRDDLLERQAVNRIRSRGGFERVLDFLPQRIAASY